MIEKGWIPRVLDPQSGLMPKTSVAMARRVMHAPAGKPIPAQVAPASSAASVASDPRLHAEQVRLLYDNLLVGLFAGILNAAILVFVQWSVIEHRVLLLWFAAIALLTVSRYVMRYAYRRTAIAPAHAGRWGRYFTVGTALSGIAWGSAGVFLFPDESSNQIFVIFVLAGMTAGAVATYSALLMAAVYFLVPALTPLIIRLFIEGHDVHLAMGVMSLIFMWMMLVVARRVYKMNLSSLEFRFTNTDLIEVLAQEKSAVEALNIELKREISERLRIERGLRESEAHIRAVVDNVLDGIITIDSDGIIESLNPAAERIFGYRAKQLIGQHFTTLIAESDRADYGDYLKKRMTADKGELVGFGLEIIGQHHGGGTFPMELGISDMWLDNRHMFIGIVRDITERKEVDLMKDRFVSAVSHELRTPLTAMLGSLGLFAEGVAGELSERGKTLLAIAHTNVERLVRLVNDILGLDDIQTGKLQLHQTPAALATLLEQVVEYGQKRARSVEVAITLKNDAPDVVVYIDGRRLRHVIDHLVSNAIKFSPHQGTVEVAAFRHGEIVRVSVTDRGPGIPVAFRDKVFQAFSQADPNKYGFQEGTGLGLTIAKAIVEKHGGQIGFDTELHAGTTFYVDIPVWRGEAPVKQTPRSCVGKS